MPRPNFFILGAPKCGTTSMYEYLSTHPAVFATDLKEPHYFATDLPARRKVKTESDYLALFEAASAEQSAIGERSTWYLFSREATRLIREFCADARLMVFLRNPVDFVQSLHVQFAYDNGQDPRFADAWRNRAERFLEFGSFGTQVERLLTVFARDQILFVLLEDLARDPKTEYRRVVTHLGLDDDGLDVFGVHNARKVRRSNRVDAFIQHTPEPLARLWFGFKGITGLGHVGVLDRISQMNTKAAPSREIDEDLREEIRAAFARDVELLASLIGRDLSHWM